MPLSIFTNHFNNLTKSAFWSLIQRKIETPEWDNLTTQDWSFLMDQVKSMNLDQVKALQVIVVLQNPNLAYKEKVKLLKKSKVLKNIWRNLNSSEFKFKWINESAFIFLYNYFSDQDWTNHNRSFNVCSKMKTNDLAEPLYFYWLLKNSSYYQKECIKKPNILKKFLYIILQDPKLDITNFIPAKTIEEFWQNLYSRLNAGHYTYLNYDDIKIYKAHQDNIDKAFKIKKAPLELFSPLFTYQLNSGGGENWSSDCFDFVKKCRNQPVREFVFQNFGTKSSKFISYLKSEVGSLANFLEFKPSFLGVKDLLQNDWNLIWQLLDDKKIKLHKKIRFDNYPISVYRPLLSTSQWVVMLKEIGESQCSNDYEAHRTLMRNLDDTIRMVVQCHVEGQINPLIDKLHTLFRFNDYNTISKLHEKIIVLYNQVTQKEYPLNVETLIPDLANHLPKLDNDLEVMVPQTNTDMILWGQRLNICVGSYAKDVKAGKTLVLGIKENQQIKYCVELNYDGQVIQFKGQNNNPAPSILVENLKNWGSTNSHLFAHVQLAKKQKLKEDWITELDQLVKLNLGQELFPSLPKVIVFLNTLIKEIDSDKVNSKIYEDGLYFCSFIVRRLEVFKENIPGHYLFETIIEFIHLLEFINHKKLIPAQHQETYELLMNELKLKFNDHKVYRMFMDFEHRGFRPRLGFY